MCIICKQWTFECLKTIHIFLLLSVIIQYMYMWEHPSKNKPQNIREQTSKQLCFLSHRILTTLKMLFWLLGMHLDPALLHLEHAQRSLFPAAASQTSSPGFPWGGTNRYGRYFMAHIDRASLTQEQLSQVCCVTNPKESSNKSGASGPLQVGDHLQWRATTQPDPAPVCLHGGESIRFKKKPLLEVLSGCFSVSADR